MSSCCSLSRFRFINKFKPLLDAYQGPYQTDFYYWSGLQLIIRVMIFGVSPLDRQTNIGISIIFISMIIGLHGTVQPVKFNTKITKMWYYSSIFKYCMKFHCMIKVLQTLLSLYCLVLLFFTSLASSSITSSLMCMVECNMQLMIKVHTRFITRLCNKTQHKQFQLEDRICDNIPEVAFNYSEYREPLVGQD